MKTTKINEMRNASQYCKNWFEGNDFFNTVFEDKSEKNLFITSERYDEDTPKKYSIRYFNEKTNQILTVGDFQQFDTLEDAKVNKRLLIESFRYIRKDEGYREKSILEGVFNIEVCDNENYDYKIEGLTDTGKKFFYLNINTYCVSC